MPLLFSYGTLQQETVQVATFGRRLAGREDELRGYELVQVPVRDPGRVAATGRTHNPNPVFTGRGESRVSGTALEVTDAELAAADAYERPDAYVRIAVTLASGAQAWMYVDSRSGNVSREHPEGAP